MKIQHCLLITLALYAPSFASADLVKLTGGTPADFGYYTPQDLADALDPWPSSTALLNPIVEIAPSACVDVIYRGGFDDAWALEFDVDGLYDRSSDPALVNANPGDKLSNLTAEEFLAFHISNEAAGNGLSDPIWNSLAIEQIGNTLEVGWNGTSFYGDYGYQRFLIIIKECKKYRHYRKHKLKKFKLNRRVY